MRISFRRQVEPIARPRNCLNCGVAVPPESIYCGQCGQENEATPVSFAALMREGWDEFIKIDKKLLATLGLLLFRPGYLTGEFVRGRRTAYLSPFKMYITVSALFFLVFGLVVPFDQLNDLDEKVAQLEKKREVDRQKQTQNKSGAKQPVKNSKKEDGVVTVTTGGKSLTDSEDFLAAWKEIRAGHLGLGNRQIPFSELPNSVLEYRDAQDNKPQAKRDRPLKHYVMERLIRFRNNPADAARNLFSTGLPFLLLLQLPMFAIWMRMIYYRQRRLYVEHLVFILHTHTFFFLLFGVIFAADALAQSLGTKIPMLNVAVTWLILTGIVTLYNILAYKRFYAQGWGKTLVKGWFLLHGYLFLLAFTSGISAAVALLWTLFAPG